MNRVRVISSSGRKSPVSRPVSPRDWFPEVPQAPVPPVPTHNLKPPKSPILRSATTRPSGEAVPPVPFLVLPRRRHSSSRLVSSRIPDANPPPVPPLLRRNTSPYPNQGDVRSGYLAFPTSRSTPTDLQYQPRDLTDRITRVQVDYSAYGGYGAVWRGCLDDNLECPVAIKVLRAHTENEEEKRKLNKRLCREIEIWKRLDHRNVVPLLGTVTTPERGPYISTGMVSPWMVNRDLTKFLQSQKATLTLSRRLQLLCDIAYGLDYLHSMGVIHGDLTGSNILIDHDGKARLVDFGLSTIKAEFDGTSYYSPTVGGALRWRALELVSTSEENEPLVLTAACDISSYGSITLQVLSGEVPYYGVAEPYVLGRLCKGIRPRRPVQPALADIHWDFIQDCWRFTPGARPPISQVVSRVLAFHQACIEVESNAQPQSASSYIVGIGRNRRHISPTDGYEPDSEEIHDPKCISDSLGWEPEQEVSKRRKTSSKKLRVEKKPQTIALLDARRLQKETAIRAIRTFDLQSPSVQPLRILICHEISTIKAGTHPNVRNIIDVEGVDVIRVSLEPIIGTSLRDILQKNTLSCNQISHLCSKIVDGLEHLHSLGVVHGNLNSKTVLLDNEGRLKLTEFGLSTRIANLDLGSTDTDNIPWTAPEAIAYGQWSSAMDIWSLGIISIELVEKEPPYFDQDPLIARESIVSRGTPTLKDPNAFTWEFIHFLSSCLVGNVLERATAAELRTHGFLSTACSLLGLIPLLDVDAQRAY